MSKRINSKRDLQPLLEKMAAKPGIRHKLIRLYLMARPAGVTITYPPSAVAAEGGYNRNCLLCRVAGHALAALSGPL